MERSGRQEILDVEEVGREELWRVMRRLQWQNWVSGNNWLIYWYVWRLIASKSGSASQQAVSILDVGTGIADIPVYLLEKFSRDGVRAKVTGIDTNRAVLDIARAKLGERADVAVLDARLEDIADHFDVVIASQMLHHLDPEEAADLLRVMYEKAQIGIVISDFSRSLIWYWVVKLFMYATFADRINRHDGPLSILRAYTSAEITTLLHQAGIAHFKIHNFLFRKIIVIYPR